MKTSATSNNEIVFYWLTDQGGVTLRAIHARLRTSAVGSIVEIAVLLERRK
jgi:hypothetical protein